MPRRIFFNPIFGGDDPFGITFGEDEADTLTVGDLLNALRGAPHFYQPGVRLMRNGQCLDPTHHVRNLPRQQPLQVAGHRGPHSPLLPPPPKWRRLEPGQPGANPYALRRQPPPTYQQWQNNEEEEEEEQEDEEPEEEENGVKQQTVSDSKPQQQQQLPDAAPSQPKKAVSAPTTNADVKLPPKPVMQVHFRLHPIGKIVTCVLPDTCTVEQARLTIAALNPNLIGCKLYLVRGGFRIKDPQALLTDYDIKEGSIVDVVVDNFHSRQRDAIEEELPGTDVRRRVAKSPTPEEIRKEAAKQQQLQEEERRKRAEERLRRKREKERQELIERQRREAAERDAAEAARQKQEAEERRRQEELQQQQAYAEALRRAQEQRRRQQEELERKRQEEARRRMEEEEATRQHEEILKQKQAAKRAREEALRQRAAELRQEKAAGAQRTAHASAEQTVHHEAPTPVAEAPPVDTPPTHPAEASPKPVAETKPPVDPVVKKLEEVRAEFTKMRDQLAEKHQKSELSEYERKFFHETSMRLLFKLDTLEDLPQDAKADRKALVTQIQRMQDELAPQQDSPPEEQGTEGNTAEESDANPSQEAERSEV